jgi:hypothetical protein
MNRIMMDNDILMIMVAMVDIYWFWMVMDILNDMFYCGEKIVTLFFEGYFFYFGKKSKHVFLLMLDFCYLVFLMCGYEQHCDFDLVRVWWWWEWWSLDAYPTAQGFSQLQIA